MVVKTMKTPSTKMVVPTGKMYEQRTERPSKDLQKELVAESLNFHSGAFKLLGVTNPHFYLKIPFQSGLDINNKTPHISLYEEEMCNTKDPVNGFFFELVDNNYNLKSLTNRVLYRWRGNSDTKDEGYFCKKEEWGQRWFVPIEEAEEINLTRLVLESKQKKNTSSLDLEVVEELEGVVENYDENMNKMTIKDMCAIQWGKPISSKEWLNELIRKNFNHK